jgi:mono/diheme cytochrome c family protein
VIDGRRLAGIGLAIAAVAVTVAVTLPLFRAGPVTAPDGVRSDAMDAPPPYARRPNPRAGETAAVALGAGLFLDNCSPCHGERGDGHGPASEGLDPPAADFIEDEFLARRSDAYLYYRISEGVPGTAMPSFHGVLDDAERWALVTFLRSLEPAHGTATATATR